MRRAFFNLPFVYKILRPLVLGGLNTPAFLTFVDAGKGDKILDVGCGYGLLAKYFRHCDYIGIDFDAERIAWAKKNIGETPNRHYVHGNILKTEYPDGHFDKAVGYGVIHHLSDDEVCGILKTLGRIVEGHVVFSDPVYSSFHLFSNLLCRLDTGHHVRNPRGYLKLYSESMDVVDHKYYYSNNKLAKYFLAKCKGKR